MTRLVIELDDAAAQRLAERAAREGIEPSALAQRLLSEASEVDPFEFVGSFASNSVAGRNADDLLERERFGSTLIALHESIDSPETQPESTAGRLFRFFRLCRRVG